MGHFDKQPGSFQNQLMFGIYTLIQTSLQPPPCGRGCRGDRAGAKGHDIEFEINYEPMTLINRETKRKENGI
jgi:hypothetical protein